MNQVIPESNLDSTLPTAEEFSEKLKQHKKSTLGNMFPILKEERARVTVAFINYFIIGFVYAFLRLYKDKVIYNFLEASAVNWLKPINTVVSLILVGFIQSLMTKHGVNAGVAKSLLWMSVFMIAMCGLMFIKDFPYVQPNPLMGKELFIGKTAELRAVGFFKCFILVCNSWVMSLFYVVSEVFGSTVVSYLYCTYMSYNTIGDQNGRFLKIIYIGANLALLLSGIVYPRIVGKALKGISYANAQIAYSVVFLFCAVCFIASYFIMQYNNKLFSVPLFIETSKAQKTTKKKVKTGLSDGLMMAIESKLLMAMCAITLFYNFSNAVNSALTKTTYKSVGNFYAMNPSLVKDGKEPMPVDAIAGKYQGLENTCVSITVIIIMCIPIFTTLFEKFGIGLFGCISIVISAAAAMAAGYFSLLNYPGDHNGKAPIFGYSLASKDKYAFDLEAMSVTFFNGAIKVGKYAFFDIIKESVSMKIDLTYRSVFKSVFDGVFGKLGKSAGSGYGIIISSITGIDDARYNSPLTGGIVCSSCLGWGVAIYYLHYNYKKSVENDSYMSLGFSKSYNKEE